MEDWFYLENFHDGEIKIFCDQWLAFQFFETNEGWTNPRPVVDRTGQ